MKPFLIKTLLFSFLAIATIEFGSFFLKITGVYTYYITGLETYRSIKKSKLRNPPGKILIIGDSVGKQLFHNRKYNNEIYSLACLQSISMAGQYFLLKNYLDAGNEIDTLFLVCTPFTLANNLDEGFTFHYFLKPFGEAEYSGLFTETVKNQINKIPYHYLTKSSYVLTSKWTPDFKPTDSIDFTFLSPISIEYLTKIKDLSIQNNFDFKIIPTPTKESRKDEVKAFNRDEFLGYNFEGELSDYLDEVIYLEDSNFLDKVHLKFPEKQEKYLKEKYLGIIDKGLESK